MLGDHGFSVGEATNVAIALVVVLLIGAIGGALLIQRTAHRVAAAIVLCVLATIVWTQRMSTASCVDDAVGIAGECSFFGKTVRTTPGD